MSRCHSYQSRLRSRRPCTRFFFEGVEVTSRSHSWKCQCHVSSERGWRISWSWIEAERGVRHKFFTWPTWSQRHDSSHWWQRVVVVLLVALLYCTCLLAHG